MCPVVGAIKGVVTESRLLVVRHLFTGPKRFNELLRVSGINSKTLSATLKFLEERGIVWRKVLSTRPFTVEYSLSTSGEELKPVLESLGNWGSKWLPEFNPKPKVHPTISGQQTERDLYLSS
jgi:DNA-binding HxlR family transcriptional regulator